jgi:hypothetical protein
LSSPTAKSCRHAAYDATLAESRAECWAGTCRARIKKHPIESGEKPYELFHTGFFFNSRDAEDEIRFRKLYV